jgi:hypothetical protein
MTAPIFRDRVRETTLVVGTGPAALLGAVLGSQPFSVIGDGGQCYYCIADQNGPHWEVGLGTYSAAGNQLLRTSVLAGSNGTGAVDFPAGTKDVFLDYPAAAVVAAGTPATLSGLTITGLSGVLKASAGVLAGSATTTDLPEGANLYYSDVRAAAAAPVQSVFGRTGVVVLQSGDVTTALGGTPALVGQANTFTTGTQKVQSGGAATKALVVQAAASQSANLTEWQGSTGAILASVGPAGVLSVPSASIGSLAGVLKATAGVVSGSATTSDLPEGSNFYYTDLRASAAAPVQSVFGRTGAVVLQSSDVTTVLGGTPALLGQANTFTTGTQKVQSGGVATKALVVQAAASQSANLTEWQDSTGTALASVGPAGSLTVSAASIGSLAGVLKATAGAVSGSATTSDLPEGSNLYFTNSRASAAAPVQSVFGRTGAVVLQSSDVTTALGFSDFARTGVANTFTIGTQTIQTGAAGTKGLVVQGVASQSANLTEWQNSSGTVLMSVRGSDGALVAKAGQNILSYPFNGGWLFANALYIQSGNPSEISTNSTGVFGWHSNAIDPLSGSHDTGLGRNAGGVVEVNNGTAGQWGALKCGVRDSGTTTITDGLTIGHQSTATPAAGLGSAALFNINSSTTADRNAGRLAYQWVTATDASRKARGTLTVYDTAEREAIRFEASGTEPMLGFYGVSATARQVLATGAGATVDTIISALQTLGLVKQS